MLEPAFWYIYFWRGAQCGSRLRSSTLFVLTISYAALVLYKNWILIFLLRNLFCVNVINTLIVYFCSFKCLLYIYTLLSLFDINIGCIASASFVYVLYSYAVHEPAPVSCLVGAHMLAKKELCITLCFLHLRKKRITLHIWAC